MNRDERVPLPEAIRILSARLIALNAGGGLYTKDQRARALADCERWLHEAWTAIQTEA